MTQAPLEDVLAEEFRTIYAAIRSNPADAEAKLAALKARLTSLEFTSYEAKVLRDQARESITNLEAQLAWSRFTLPELEAKLRANPDDMATLTMYERKATDAVFAQAFTDPVAARKTTADVKAVLESIRPTGDAAKAALARARSWSSTPEFLAQASRPLRPGTSKSTSRPTPTTSWR